MRRILLYAGSIVLVSLAGIVLWAAFRVRASSVHSESAYRGEWSPAAAANYLDSREVWWQDWPFAQLEKGTVCVSCHTVVPYALVRPALRQHLGETDLSSTEKKMLNSIKVRVSEWPQMKPYYTDAAHSMQSHSTEAILNAVILSEYSTKNDPVLRHAFDNAWALQETTGKNTGAWQWQDFHEAPWESVESVYQGAAMMAIAAQAAYAQDSNVPAILDHMDHLRDYLRNNYSAQPAMNQLYAVWASAEMSGLLSDSQRDDLIRKVARLQNTDGGWSLSSLDKQENLKPAVLDLLKHAGHVDGSDGCATGLAMLAMEKVGIDSKNLVLQRGLAWLRTHQSQDGSWWASSMNGFRDPSSGMGHFMTDAATGYAVMALKDAEQRAIKPSIDSRATDTNTASR